MHTCMSVCIYIYIYIYIYMLPHVGHMLATCWPHVGHILPNVRVRELKAPGLEEHLRLESLENWPRKEPVRFESFRIRTFRKLIDSFRIVIPSCWPLQSAGCMKHGGLHILTYIE